MAVRMDDYLGVKFGRSISAHIEKIAKQESVVGEDLRPRIIREHLQQFVLEHRHASGLEADKRDCRIVSIKHGRQRIENRLQTLTGCVEVTIVVERPTATEAPRGQLRVKASNLEYVDCGIGDFWMKVLAEGVHPKHHLLQ